MKMDWVITLKMELQAKPLHKLSTQYVLSPYNVSINFKRYYKPVLSVDEIFSEVVTDALEPVLIDPKYENSYY